LLLLLSRMLPTSPTNERRFAKPSQPMVVLRESNEVGKKDSSSLKRERERGREGGEEREVEGKSMVAAGNSY
jgi:hypothetical protein